MDPNRFGNLNNLGHILMDLRRVSEALIILNKAYSLRGIFSGNTQNVTKKLETANESELPNVVNHLGLAYRLSNKPEEALLLWEKELQLKPHYIDYALNILLLQKFQ